MCHGMAFVDARRKTIAVYLVQTATTTRNLNPFARSTSETDSLVVGGLGAVALPSI